MSVLNGERGDGERHTGHSRIHTGHALNLICQLLGIVDHIGPLDELILRLLKLFDAV